MSLFAAEHLNMVLSYEGKPPDSTNKNQFPSRKADLIIYLGGKRDHYAGKVLVLVLLK